MTAADSDYISRRVRRHLNDLERTNYIESTSTVHGGEEEDEKAGARASAAFSDADEGRHSSLSCAGFEGTDCGGRDSRKTEKEVDDGSKEPTAV